MVVATQSLSGSTGTSCKLLGVTAAGLAVVLTHAIYLTWILQAFTMGRDGALRALAALLAATFLVWQALNRKQPQTPRTSRLGTMVMASAALLAVLAAFGPPALWALSLPLAVLGFALVRGGWDAVRRAATGILVCAAAFPTEIIAGTTLDHALQLATAQCAMQLLNLSGLPVTLLTDPPTLLGANLIVHVTALCAGASTMFALLTLGLMVGEAMLSDTPAKWGFVLLAPLFGFLGNVVRVAISTRAAVIWGGNADAWAIAHDAIGYSTFLLTYAALFCCVLPLRKLRRASHPATPSSASQP